MEILLNLSQILAVEKRAGNSKPGQQYDQNDKKSKRLLLATKSTNVPWIPKNHTREVGIEASISTQPKVLFV